MAAIEFVFWGMGLFLVALSVCVVVLAIIIAKDFFL